LDSLILGNSVMHLILALLDKYEAIPTGDADDTGGSPRLLATNNSAQYAVGDLLDFCR